VMMGQLHYLLPHYYLLNALIILGRNDSEWRLRTAVLQGQILVGLLDLCWAAKFPQGLSPKLVAAAASAATLLQAIHIGLAFCADASTYTSTVAIVLHVSVLLMYIPVAQVGSNYTLQRRISPARYRILAWLSATVFALAVLIVPAAASPWVALPCSIVPSLSMALALVAPDLFGIRPYEAPSSAPEAAGAKKEIAEGAKSTCPGQLVTGLPSALEFLILGCGFGTIGEAFTDMAINLAIRSSLKAGKQDLALTNQLMVFASMILAYWSETRPSASNTKRAIWFLMGWALCQAVRIMALQELESGSVGNLLLAAMVFMDKYTGPLGAAALETALLAVLVEGDEQNKAQKQSGLQIQGSLLWTMRMIVGRMERPICQLVLLHSAGTPVALLSSIFTMLTSVMVLSILQRQSSRELKAKSD